SSLVIGGAYDLTIYRRVSDAVNGEQRRYIPLRDATIAPMERVQQAQRVPHLLVDRGEALLIATLQEATPPSDYARDEQIRGVVPITAMFFTTAFVVRATFHKRPDLTLPDALSPCWRARGSWRCTRWPTPRRPHSRRRPRMPRPKERQRPRRLLRRSL